MIETIAIILVMAVGVIMGAHCGEQLESTLDRTEPLDDVELYADGEDWNLDGDYDHGQ